MRDIKVRKVAIIGGVRTPFVRSNGKYVNYNALDVMSGALKALVEKYHLEREVLGEVALGTVFFPPSNWNFARDVLLKSGLTRATPALGIQRACATSLDGAIAVANKIALGQIESGIAGGAESMSSISLFLQPQFSRRIIGTAQGKTLKDRMKAWKGFTFGDLKLGSPAVVEPLTGKSMGQHCELMVQEWKISREAQDELSLKSHKNAAAAYEKGFYKDLIQPFGGAENDEFVRKDTSLERLGKLKPVFAAPPTGTLTAGNSSPFTDGGACVLLGSEQWAKDRGLPVLAYLTDFETAALDLQHEGLLMAPTYAVSRMLARNEMPLGSFDFYEIHEAFAGQVLCTLKAWESKEYCKKFLGRDSALGPVDRGKMNVVGGSVALGHPFGATGARIMATLAKLLNAKGSGKGLISICTGGGMGTAAILEK